MCSEDTEKSLPEELLCVQEGTKKCKVDAGLSKKLVTGTLWVPNFVRTKEGKKELERNILLQSK